MTTQIVENSKVQSSAPLQDGTVYRVLIAVSFCHLMNDTMQSLLPSIYPILKTAFHLNFGQIGLLTLTFQMTASILQPFIGHFTDHKPLPYSLPIGMVFTLTGLLLLSIAPTFPLLLLAASLIGMGSAVFHPESSRVARLASGGRLGLAQSVFQVGGNTGSAIGPLLAAFIVLPHGQRGVAWFSLVALVAIVVLTRVSRWYKPRLGYLKKRSTAACRDRLIARASGLGDRGPDRTRLFQVFLFGQLHQLLHLLPHDPFSPRGAEFADPPVCFSGSRRCRNSHWRPDWRPHWAQDGDLVLHPRRFAPDHAAALREPVLDHVLSVLVGLGLASAFPAILVYAQELVPGRVGMISGLFFGFAFGMGGIGAAILGRIADATSILFVYKICAYLPAIGLLAGFLPSMSQRPLRINEEVE